MAVRTRERPDVSMVALHGLLTSSRCMLDFFDLIARVAQTDSTILVRGQTGTGKELVAQAIHRLSRRAKGPYRAINCATLTPELLASELFGHLRGSFTGAIKDRRGLFALADRGTIFLDEIAEIPLELQARLLRVLEQREVVPLGGAEPIKVDVRIISATNRALRREVENKQFRADLMYRLRVVPIFLPTLVERERDVEVLAWEFIDRFNQKHGRVIEAVSADAMDAMLAYHWPGNVRELHNVIEYAFAVGVGPVLSLADLTPEIRGEPPPRDSLLSPCDDEVNDERARLKQALRDAGGRKAEAAERLGMSRSTLWRKLREYKLS